jgi:hypothetical protein
MLFRFMNLPNFPYLAYKINITNDLFLYFFLSLLILLLDYYSTF